MSDIANARKLYVPGFAGLHRALAPYGYVIIRAAAGLIIIPHGWPKLFGGAAPAVAANVVAKLGFPAPLAFAYFLGILEVFGGLALAFGLFTRPIALMLTVEFAVITFAWQFPNGFAFSAPHGGYEYPLVLMFVYFGILLRGSDRCSIDSLIGKEF